VTKTSLMRQELIPLIRFCAKSGPRYALLPNFVQVESKIKADDCNQSGKFMHHYDINVYRTCSAAVFFFLIGFHKGSAQP
jgi:hypothetical protein